MTFTDLSSHDDRGRYGSICWYCHPKETLLHHLITPKPPHAGLTSTLPGASPVKGPPEPAADFVA